MKAKEELLLDTVEPTNQTGFGAEGWKMVQEGRADLAHRDKSAMGGQESPHKGSSITSSVFSTVKSQGDWGKKWESRRKSCCGASFQSHTEPLCQEAEGECKGAQKRAGEEDWGLQKEGSGPGVLEAPRELQPPSDGLGKGKAKSLKNQLGLAFAAHSLKICIWKHFCTGCRTEPYY